MQASNVVLVVSAFRGTGLSQAEAVWILEQHIVLSQPGWLNAVDLPAFVSFP